jgi:hypothetical protein
MHDLVRALKAAMKDRTRKRREIRSFLLRMEKVYQGKKARETQYYKWLHELSLAWQAHIAVLNEMLLADAIYDYLLQHNAKPRSFARSKSAKETLIRGRRALGILDKIPRNRWQA